MKVRPAINNQELVKFSKMEIDEADLGDNMDQSDEKTPDLNDEGMCVLISIIYLNKLICIL